MYRPENDGEALVAMRALVEAIACSNSDDTINDVSVHIVVEDDDDEPTEFSAWELAQALFEYNTTG